MGMAFWLGLAVLMIGIVVAVLGVRSAAAAYQRHLDLERYTTASAEAHDAASIGADAVTAGRQLLALDRSDASAATEMRKLIMDGKTDGYTSRAAVVNRESSDQARLVNAMVAFHDKLRRALGDHTVVTPGATPRATPSVTPPSPVTIAAWPDVPLRTVCLDAKGSFEGRPITADQVDAVGALSRRLQYRGLVVAAAGTPCDARLTVRFKGTAQSADYDRTSLDKWLLIPAHLYTGARITGTLALTATGQPPISIDQSINSAPDKRATPDMIENMTQPADGLAHIRLWLDKGLTKLGLAETRSAGA